MNRKYEETEAQFVLRAIRQEEAEEAALIEQICFPPNEACTPERIRERVEAAPQLFLTAICTRTGEMAGFLNGLSTDETVFRDEFFTDISLYRPEGSQIMLLGLDVLPAYRRRGLATLIVRRYAQMAREMGKKRLILTCLDEKVPMYEKMGFRDLGLSGSSWGGEAWHEMDMNL